MFTKIITDIQKDLTGILDGQQLSILAKVLHKHLSAFTTKENTAAERNGYALLPLFIAAKRVEGCSEKSLCYSYYNNDIKWRCTL